MKNEKLDERVVDYFDLMIEHYFNDNNPYVEVGELNSFLFEESEKTDSDVEWEEDIENFFYVREYILNEGGVIEYILEIDDDEEIKYTFKVIDEDIECCWIEPSV